MMSNSIVVVILLGKYCLRVKLIYNIENCIDCAQHYDEVRARQIIYIVTLLL
jgi:hypothetical protein